MLSPFTYWLVLASVAAYALWRGRGDERAAALVCVVATVASVLVNSPLTRRFTGIEAGVLIVDLLALAAFTAIALRTNRFWPLWVAGFQLTSTFAHGLKAVHFSLLPQVYAAAERFWVYPIFLAIVIGTWRTQRRIQQQAMAPALP
jgi:O-antigen/teichoic acid export membrane protein